MNNGLSSQEAKTRLKRYGFNELPSTKPKQLGKIIVEVIREPMFLLLLSAALIYILLGDYTEGMVLLGWVLVIIFITFYQHRKTERSLELLKQLSSPRALVVRDGKIMRISGREVVPGDLFILNEGDRVPADATVIESHYLMLDESLLTGESIAVVKEVTAPKNALFSGSLVVKGSGRAIAQTTGTQTQFGQIGKSLQSIEKQPTRLQLEMKVLIRNLFIAGIAISASVVAAFYFTRGNFLESLLNGLAASMALLPEEFPVVLTIFLALGAWRLSKNHVLTREPAAIETLGAASVLCSDKTGTITQNKMEITSLWDGKTEYSSEPFEEAYKHLIRTLFFASSLNSIDPMEKAIKSRYDALGHSEEISLIEEYPLSQERFAMTRVIRSSGDLNHFAYCKGSPEAVMDMCALSADEEQRVMRQLTSFTAQGYRVLAFASCEWPHDTLPTDQSVFPFILQGLVCFEDPIRSEVPASIKECKEAGIQVIMITGDYPVTATSIAAQIGLENAKDVISGDQLEKMTDQELSVAIRNTQVFARIIPPQKMRIIQALKANGEVVAMTGDGVNDAPALKAADIGIAMGMIGTDVAREASSLVLLDDNFTSIVGAIRSGRRIYDNLEKAMAYIIAIHIPIIGLVLLPGFFPELPIILMPLHIVFMELIIDPACSIAFESEQEEEGIMQRPPREQNQRFFGWKTMFMSIVKGSLLLLTAGLIYFLSLKEGHSPSQVRSMTFATLITGNLILIIHLLSGSRNFISVLKERNRALLFIATLAFSLLILILSVPFFQTIFSLEALGIEHFIPAALGVIALLVMLETIKWFRRTNTKKTK